MDTLAEPTPQPPPTDPTRMAKGLTVAAAVAVALGGILHLRVWDSDYRDIPDGAAPGLWVVKAGFPINAAASIVIAIALAVIAFGIAPRARRAIVAMALALQVGSVVALVASRGPGIFGWSEQGYEGDAVQILIVEVVAIALLVASIAVDRIAGEEKS